MKATIVYDNIMKPLPIWLSFLLLLTFINIVYSEQKFGLLIIAHGSPMPEWNKKVLEVEKDVKRIMAQRNMNQFTIVRVSFMEFIEPSIQSVIKDFNNEGIHHIFAIPLFIAPSGHSVFDIPAIMGLYGDQEVRMKIKEEGTAIVRTKIKITVGPTMNSGDVLKEIMLTRVKELSIEPASEAVVLLAHGDDDFLPFWDSLCQNIGYHICAHTGIDYFDYAFVEVGQAFSTQGVPTILRAIENKPRTLVIGLYLSMDLEKMAKSSVSSFRGQATKRKFPFTDKNVIFSSKGLLPDNRIAQWIVDIGGEWTNGL